MRRDYATNWINSHAVLQPGEPGFATDTLQFKIGNGVNEWNDLSAIGTSGIGPTGTIAFFNSVGALTGSSALTFVRTTDTVTGTTGHTGPTNLITLDGSMLPALNNTYSLGATGMVWRDIHVGPGTIYVGDSKFSSDGITFVGSSGTVSLSVSEGAIQVITTSSLTGDTGTTLDLTHAGITEFVLTDPTVQEHISTIGGPTGPRGPSFFYGSSTGTLTGTFNTPAIGDFWINTITGELYVKNS